MSDDRRRVDEGAVVPVFPLPDLVFFPETVIPLHVFETRYREMVKEASEGENLIGLALLRPGFEENYDGSPEIHPIGTVGQIEQLRPLPDGRFLLNLRGLARVAYREVPSGRSYRTACVGLRHETAADPADPDLESARMDLVTTHALLARALNGTDAPTLMMNDRISFAAAVNRACLDLPVAAELRQALLVLNDLRERRRRVSRLLDEILLHVLSGKNETSGNELPS